jgi:hypothetical protein
MPSPSQPLITLPLSDRLYLYIYIYSAECLKTIKKNKKAAAEVNQFRRIKGKLTFKLNVSTKLY